MSMKPEAKLKMAFRAYMKKRGAYHFAPVQTGYGKRTVDDIFCLKGRFIGAEAKAPGRYKQPWDGCSGPQKQALLEIAQAGGVAICYDDVQYAIGIVEAQIP